MSLNRITKRVGRYLICGQLRGRFVRPVVSGVQFELESEISKGKVHIPHDDKEWDELIDVFERVYYKGVGPIFLHGRYVSTLPVDEDQRVRVLCEAELCGVNYMSPARVWDDLIRMVYPVNYNFQKTFSDYREIDLLHSLAMRTDSTLVYNESDGLLSDHKDMVEVLGMMPFDTAWGEHPPKDLKDLSVGELEDRVRRLVRKTIHINSYNFAHFFENHGFEVDMRGRDGVVRAGLAEVMIDTKTGRVRIWSQARPVIEQWMRLNRVDFDCQDVLHDVYQGAGFFLLERELDNEKKRFTGGPTRADFHPDVGKIFMRMRDKMFKQNFYVLSCLDIQTAVAVFFQRNLDTRERVDLMAFIRANQNVDGIGYARFLSECPEPERDNEVEMVKICSMDEKEYVELSSSFEVDDVFSPVIAEQCCGPFVGDEVNPGDGSETPLLVYEEVEVVESITLRDPLSVVTRDCDIETMSSGVGYRGLVDYAHKRGYLRYALGQADEWSFEASKYEVIGVSEEAEFRHADMIFSLCIMTEDDVRYKIGKVERDGCRPSCVLISLFPRDIPKDHVAIRLAMNYKRVRIRMERNGLVSILFMDRFDHYMTQKEMDDLENKKNKAFRLESKRLKKWFQRVQYFNALSRIWYGDVQRFTYDGRKDYEHEFLSCENTKSRCCEKGKHVEKVLKFFVVCGICDKMLGVRSRTRKLCFDVEGRDACEADGIRYIYDPPRHCWRKKTDKYVIEKCADWV